MKLSELIELRKTPAIDGEERPTAVFGVEVDDDLEDFDPPLGITEIGLVARLKDDGDFSDEFLDVVIAYQNLPEPVSVLVEIPAGEVIKDTLHLVSTIEAIQVSAAFLPPETLDEETFEAYCVRIEDIASVWASRSNFTQAVLPVTSYFQHMIVSLLDPELGRTFVPDDPYIVDKFHSKLPLEKSDALKARLYRLFHEGFTTEEGEDLFDDTMMALCRTQYAGIEDIARDLTMKYPHLQAAVPEGETAEEAVSGKTETKEKKTASRKRKTSAGKAPSSSKAKSTKRAKKPYTSAKKPKARTSKE